MNRLRNLLGAVLIASPLVSAQGFTLQNDYEGSAGFPGQYFTSSEMIDINRSGLPDLVTRTLQGISVAFDIGKTVIKDKAIGASFDFDVLEAFPGVDASIISISGTGLWRTWIDDTVANDPVWDSELLAPFTLGVSSLLHVSDSDKDGDDDILVYDSATGYFHFLVRTATQWVYVPAASFVYPGVIDFEPITLPSATSESLLIMTATGVETIELDGTASYPNAVDMPYQPTSATSLDLTVMRHGGEDYYVYLYSLPPVFPATDDTHHIAIGQADGPFTSEVDAGVRTVGAGKVDGDANHDLVLNLAPTYQVGSALNVGTATPSFSLALSALDVVTIPDITAGDNPHNAAEFAFADIDGDGDCDFALPTEENVTPAGKDIFVKRSDVIDEHALAPSINSPFLLTVGTGSTTSSVVMSVAPPTNVPVGATDVEVTIWKQNTLNNYVSKHPLRAMNAPINGTALLDFTLNLGGPGTNFDSVWMIGVRAIEVDANGLIVNRHPASNYSLALYDASTQAGAAFTAYFNEITSTSGYVSVVIVSSDSAGGRSGGRSGPGSYSGDLGGGPPLECTGPHDDDIPPRPPGGTTGGTSTGGGG